MTFAVAEPLGVVILAVMVLVIRVRTGHAPRWWYLWNQRRFRAQKGQQRLGRAPQLVAAMLAVALLPWPAYLALRPHLGSDAEALTIVSALPLAWTLAHWIRCRRFDVPGVLVITVYGCAVTLSVAFGDSPLPLKLRDTGVLGLVGLACIGSALARRPLLLLALRYIARHSQRPPGTLAARLNDPRYQRDLATATTLAGGVFLFATLADLALIIAASTATFLAVAGLVGGLAPVTAAAAVTGFLRLRSFDREPDHDSHICR